MVMSKEEKDEVIELISQEIKNNAEKESKDYQSFIKAAKENLTNLNNEIIEASYYKLVFSVLFFIVGAYLIYEASNKYDEVSKGIPYITLTALQEFDKSMELINDDTRSIEQLEKKLLAKARKCRQAKNNFNNKNNSNILPLTAKGSNETQKEAFKAASIEKQKQEKICEEESKLKEKIESSRIRLEKHESELAKINPITTPLRKNVGSAYMLFFFSIFSLITAVFSFMSFLRSRDKSKEIRLKINQYHRFKLAAKQCDILQVTEDEPKILINKIFETLKSKDAKSNEELFTLLGKLKVPQRKSAEVRAELIKEIYKFHEIDFK